jgi:hypothetical protein
MHKSAFYAKPYSSGEIHDRRLPERAMIKPPGVLLTPLEAFVFIY